MADGLLEAMRKAKGHKSVTPYLRSRLSQEIKKIEQKQKDESLMAGGSAKDEALAALKGL